MTLKRCACGAPRDRTFIEHDAERHVCAEWPACAYRIEAARRDREAICLAFARAHGISMMISDKTLLSLSLHAVAELMVLRDPPACTVDRVMGCIAGFNTRVIGAKVLQPFQVDDPVWVHCTCGGAICTAPQPTAGRIYDDCIDDDGYLHVDLSPEHVDCYPDCSHVFAFNVACVTRRES